MNRSLISILCLLVFILSSAPSVQAKLEKKKDGVVESVVIETPQDQVWKTITNAKKFDASISSEKKNEAVVVQKFKMLPVFGECITRLRVTAVPRKTIEYKMIESNKLKDLAGAWTLTPISDEETKLELYSFVDPGLPIPRFIINHFVRHKVKGRLKKTKRIAEKSYTDSSSAFKAVDSKKVSRSPRSGKSKKSSSSKTVTTGGKSAGLAPSGATDTELQP